MVATQLRSHLQLDVTIYTDCKSAQTALLKLAYTSSAAKGENSYLLNSILQASNINPKISWVRSHPELHGYSEWTPEMHGIYIADIVASGTNHSLVNYDIIEHVLTQADVLEILMSSNKWVWCHFTSSAIVPATQALSSHDSRWKFERYLCTRDQHTENKEAPWSNGSYWLASKVFGFPKNSLSTNARYQRIIFNKHLHGANLFRFKIKDQQGHPHMGKCNHCRQPLANQDHIFRHCMHDQAVSSRQTLRINLLYFIDKLRHTGDHLGHLLCSNIFNLAFHHPLGVRVWLSNYTKGLALAACTHIPLEKLPVSTIQRLSMTLVRFQQIFVPAVSDLWSTAQALLYGTELTVKTKQFQSTYKYPLASRARKPRRKKLLQTPVPRPTERSVVSLRSLAPMSNISRISVLQKGHDVVDLDTSTLPIDPDLHELDNYADIIYDYPDSLTHFAYQPP
jgi:hypothetical protein